jgi:hypothetical protein
MFGLRPVHLYFPADQYEEFARYAASRGIGIDAAVIDLATRAEAAEAECERLRAELEVTRDLLSDAPMGFEDYTYETWYASVKDYLETLDDDDQDAAGG